MSLRYVSFSCLILLSVNAIKVGDRLLAALGQDIFECLFSSETIERGPDGRSKLLRPFGMFILALVYNVIHAAALFYQVVTLNVAVNSYSNALLSLLMSNMFVEIKSTVFKKFEKENLFQMSCAGKLISEIFSDIDIIERFHLSLLLTLILLRNLIEHTNSLTRPLDLPWMNLCMPFIMVLGSELLVDWCKHAFVTKFNH